MASGEARYGRLADKIARKYGINPRLFRALISQESGWNPNAVSPVGARGLTQVVPKWHPDANLSTPAGQLDAGARYLKNGLQKYGNVRDALSQYNSGRPWSQGRNISETRNYVQSIMAATGSAPGAAPGVPPALGAPGAGDLQPVSGSLDIRRLMQIMGAQRKRVLQGVMPSPNYQRQIAKLVQQAKTNADVKVAVQQVGAQAAGAAAALGGLTMGGGPKDHQSRALGNWQSDDAYDLMGKAGQPIYSGVSGTVTKISGHPGGSPQFAGYGITVKTPQGDLFFKHLGSSKLKVGQKIRPGTLIGTLDPTVNGGPHLHLGSDNPALLKQLAKLYTR